MEILVLVGQRKQKYEGQYAVEVLASIDEIGNDDNPEYLIEQTEKYKSSNEFDSIAVVKLNVSDKSIYEALYPRLKSIPATVI